MTCLLALVVWLLGGMCCASCVRSCASASRCACVGIGDLSGVASVVMSGCVVSRGTSGGSS